MRSKSLLVCVVESRESVLCSEVDLESTILRDVASGRLVMFEGRDARRGAELASADALIVSHHPRISSDLIETLQSVRVIARNGAGFDNIDVQAAHDAGIPVCNVPDCGTEEVADHAILLTLALQRRLLSGLQETQAGGWDWRAAAPWRRLRGQIFGIVGCGRIGTATALRAKAFGFRVLFHDPYVVAGYEKALGAERAQSLHELLDASNVVSLHAPLTQETQGLIGFEELDAMKPEAFLVNTARGALVCEAALVSALQSERIAGAALDVLEAEPAAGPALFAHPNCLITPHMAFYSAEAIRDMREGAARVVRKVLETGLATNVVNGIQ